MRARRHRIAIWAGILVAAILGVYFAGETYQRRDHLAFFLEQKGNLESVEETPIDDRSDSTTYHLELRSDRGLVVEAYLRIPRPANGLLPVVLILGGAGTGMRTLDFLGPSSAMLLALEYPYHGKKDGLSKREFIQALPEMRQAILDTVPASSLALDYLWQRADVDRTRILLAGGSFGALFTPAVAAAEQRVSAVAILLGAADLYSLLENNLDIPAPSRQILAWIGTNIVSPMEPAKYIHRISPRPVFMLNGTEDPVMPESSARLLHDLARRPKTVRWIPMGHVELRSPEFHQVVLDALVDWLVEIQFTSPEEAASVLVLR